MSEFLTLNFELIYKKQEKEEAEEDTEKEDPDFGEKSE